ncbi:MULTISPECIES: hypothetical protein [unclassified Bacillus (in: firmicutes)]|uniref:hypothetical protein n=1 Tax=unclassified Bacillus (in: firmicutes) TaxID=185979 RepID=UPI0008E0AC42|nr:MULTISPECIES: hypothetical protein [unclassified Bacillus (in: firmicutes)]SFB04273.1 hypothetical protein SAMN02799634_104278 [Bacillus sp. UNCCL13]SFQ88541.1 hypothetical protein SAMN04488577_3236 [Bacillus sp. cl95]
MKKRKVLNRKNAIIFIGEKHNNEIEVKESVSIYDAFHLSSSVSVSSRYQIIPLPKHDKMSLIYCNKTFLNNIQLDFHQKQIHISGSDPAISPEAIIKMLSNLIIKHENKFHILFDTKESKIRKRNKQEVLYHGQEKRLE